MKVLNALSMAALFAVLCSPVFVKAEDAKGAKVEGKDEKVAIADLPKAVVDAVNKAQPGGKITEADKETKNGVVVYEVDVTNNGKNFEVKVDASGKLLSNKIDDENEADEKGENQGNNEKKK